MNALFRVAAIIFLTAPALAEPGTGAEVQKGFTALRAALHVHSRFSNGVFQVMELASHAHQRELDVLGLTDSYLTRVRYSPTFFRRLFSLSVTREGIVDHGIEDYLDAVRESQRQFDSVVVLPGVEVAPYYFWRGTPASGLELHDFDRHLLVFGLRDPDHLRNLPVIENETWSNTERDWVEGLPVISLLAGGLALLWIARRRRVYIASAVLLIGGAIWGYAEFPFGRLADPYSGQHAIEPYQRLIDYVQSNGGLTFWSYPEAQYPVVEMGPARMISDPHPEDLARTDRYTGFEGLYGDTITITDPGALWDKTLMEYIQGQRRAWPSAISGIDFHEFRDGNYWYQLDRGLTILWARQRDEISVLESLRAGRGYSTAQGHADRSLELADYALRSSGGTAVSGETLDSSGAVELTAGVFWRTERPDPSPAAFTIDIVKDGALLERLRGPLPIRVQRQDMLPAGRHYYRIRIRGDNSEILSNPIFCEVR